MNFLSRMAIRVFNLIMKYEEGILYENNNAPNEHVEAYRGEQDLLCVASFSASCWGIRSERVEA